MLYMTCTKIQQFYTLSSVLYMYVHVCSIIMSTYTQT